MTDITINVSDGAAAAKPGAAQGQPGDVKRDTAMGGAAKAGAKGKPKMQLGFNGPIMAQGKLIYVVQGVAEMDGKRIFIDAQGRVIGKTAEGKVLIVGYVKPGVLTKGAPPDMKAAGGKPAAAPAAPAK